MIKFRDAALRLRKIVFNPKVFVPIVSITSAALADGSYYYGTQQGSAFAGQRSTIKDVRINSCNAVEFFNLRAPYSSKDLLGFTFDGTLTIDEVTVAIKTTAHEKTASATIKGVDHDVGPQRNVSITEPVLLPPRCYESPKAG